MTKPTLRPALISVEKERVQALELTEQNGVLAVPDSGYRYIGDVFEQVIQQDGLHVRRWFALTVVQASLGPFLTKPLAVEALVKWNHLRSADVAETSSPLF